VNNSRSGKLLSAAGPFVGPISGVAGWLLFRTDRGQPKQASFWFAIFVAFGIGVLFGVVSTRKVGRAMLVGAICTVLALGTWLVWLSVFLGTDHS
jgi:hypothetical protein